MIIVKGSSIRSAWRDAVKQLYTSETCVGKEVFKDEMAVIQVYNTEEQDYYDELFPMSKEEIDIINDYLITGGHEERVTHEWTKIYRKRLIEGNDQIEKVVNYLKKEPSGRRAQVTIWRSDEDLYTDFVPCLQLLWFQIIEGKLVIHVHMRACDCYGKLLMNINEFSSVQRYVASKLGVEVGAYHQIIDTCHFYSKDKARVEEIVKIINS